MKKLLITTFCLCMSAFVITHAQTLSGKLIDAEQRPVSFANIVLLSLPDSAFVAGTISDE